RFPFLVKTDGFSGEAKISVCCLFDCHSELRDLLTCFHHAILKAARPKSCCLERMLSPSLKQEACCHEQTKSANELRPDRHLHIGGLAIAFCPADKKPKRRGVLKITPTVIPDPPDQIRVTIKPKILTAAIIPRTAGTPNLPFKIGRTKTPRVAPIFATPAAKPLAVARSCVGNRLGASVNVVELGPAFINKLNR